ncbi:MAG: DUF3179 domain-containing protein [bacterium]|nr:DUF3179 domain-containing protein [bacterium]
MPNRYTVPIAAVVLIAAVIVALPFMTAAAGDKDSQKPKYRGLLGPDNKKVRTEGDKTLLWAGGGKPDSAEAQWYDFTGSPISAADLQFGIGKDRIRSIDDPLFVSPDDPRLLELPPPGYGRAEKPKTNDEIEVIGYVVDGQARAYPTALLDRHELVNDRIGGKPVTVGW